MNKNIKEQLHTLIDQCDDPSLLEEAKILFQISNNTDWWDELSDEDKNLVKESEEQYNKGNVISHKELVRRFEEWRKK